MKESAKTVLVTGASGFLGSGIVRALTKSHPTWVITGLDLRPPKPDVAQKLTHFFQADVTVASTLEPAFEPPYAPDLVLHAAAFVPNRRSRYSTKDKDWQRIKSVIYDGTVNIVSAALAAGCTKLVYTSSVTAIIDDLDHDYYNMDESTPLGLATLHYGKAKGMTENFLFSPEQAHRGLEVCALRPCTIIGPEDTQVISVIVDMIAKGETLFVVGDGNNIYDWMYIDNAVDAHVLAAENMLTTGTASGHAIFITNHEPSYFWDFLAFVWAQFDHVPPFRIHIPGFLAFFVGFIFELITTLTGKAATLDTGSVKDGIRTHFANNDKAIQLLGYRPRIGLSEGVRLSCEGYRRQLAVKKSESLKS